MATDTLILMVGLPKSGKSYWAKQRSFPIVNRDAIRLALHGQAYIQDAEPMVSTIEKYMVKSLFLAGHDTVIVDATHVKQAYRDRWVSKDWKLCYKFIDTPVKKCIENAKLLDRHDLIPIIQRMNLESEFDSLSNMVPY